MEALFKIVGWIMLAFGAIIIFSILAAIPTYYLWNWLMPEIFGLKVITFWQALGMNFLASILFKSSSSSSSSKD